MIFLCFTSHPQKILKGVQEVNEKNFVFDNSIKQMFSLINNLHLHRATFQSQRKFRSCIQVSNALAEKPGPQLR